MKGQIDINSLNTIREIQICNSLGYFVVANGIKIDDISKIFLEYKILKEKLSICKNTSTEKYLVDTINVLSAFFFRCHISEDGNMEERNKIKEFKLIESYATEI